MAKTLKLFFAWIFYLLGLSYFAAYMFVLNEMYIPWPKFWLSIADLPLVLSGMVYGGASLYLSVKNPNRPAPILATFIIIPLVSLFIFLVALNFWPLITA